MDKILIKGLRVFAYHGVNPEEKENGQTFELDVTLLRDLTKACNTDLLSATVNYAKVIKLVTKVMQAQTDNLIERAAQRVADAILKEFDVDSVTVFLKKPEAPVSAKLDYAGVEITRTRVSQS